MATRFYLDNATAPYTPSSFLGAWDQPNNAVTKLLNENRNASGAGASATVTVSEANASPTWDVCLYRGVSRRLDTQTISGTVDVCIGVNEALSTADFSYHIHMWVTTGDSTTPRGTLLTDYVELAAQEWATSITGQSLLAAQSLTSVNAQVGDHLVVEIGYIARNSSSTAVSGVLRYGTSGMSGDLTAGSTSVTTLAPWIEFSGTVAIDPNVRLTQDGVLAAQSGGANVRLTSDGVLATTSGTGTNIKNTSDGVLVVTTPEVHVNLTQMGILVLRTDSHLFPALLLYG